MFCGSVAGRKLREPGRLIVKAGCIFGKVFADFVSRMGECGLSATSGCRKRFLTESIALDHWMIKLASLKLRN